MKKLVAFLICLSMLFSAVMLSSCGFPDDILGGDDEETNEDGSAVLPISQEASVEKMNTLADDQGYELCYVATTSDGSATITVGRKDGAFWFLSNSRETVDGETVEETDGTAFKLEGEQIQCYSYMDGKFVWETSVDSENYKELLSAYETTINTWLYYANIQTVTMKKGPDKTIAGRSCNTYTYDLGSAMGDVGGLIGGIIGGIADFSLKYEICVDKEYGITMAIHMEGSDKEGDETIDFEVSKFTIGNKVTMPELEQVESLLTKYGMNEKAFFASVEIGELEARVQTEGQYSISYHVASVTKETFLPWATSVLGELRKVASDGKVYESDQTTEIQAIESVDEDYLSISASVCFGNDWVNVYIVGTSDNHTLTLLFSTEE